MYKRQAATQRRIRQTTTQFPTWRMLSSVCRSSALSLPYTSHSKWQCPIYIPKLPQSLSRGSKTTCPWPKQPLGWTVGNYRVYIIEIEFSGRCKIQELWWCMERKLTRKIKTRNTIGTISVFYIPAFYSFTYLIHGLGHCFVFCFLSGLRLLE